MHWWVDCTYLNPAKRPYNWHEQADPEKAKRVNEAMKNSDMKDYVENAIKRAMEKRTQNNQNNKINQTHPPEASSAFVADQPTNGPYYGVFTTAMTPSFAAPDYFLRSSWILDNGSETHICNKTMLHRFRKTRNAPLKAVLAGETRSKIEAIGEVEISINAPGGKIWKVLFTEVCYISNFMTNVAASRKFRAKGVYFDDQNMRLHANNRTLGLVSDMNGHDVLEHQIMEHASEKDNQNLKHASNEVMKRSTPEEVKMKNERPTPEGVQVKKTEQINSSKQADNGASNRTKNEKDGAYQRANGTQSHSKIKFKSFSLISSK